MKKYFTILFLSFSICIFAQTESKSFISVTDTIFTPEIDYEKSISKITAKWISPDKIFEQPKNDNKIERNPGMLEKNEFIKNFVMKKFAIIVCAFSQISFEFEYFRI